jgi:UrcA family protein
MNTHKHIRPTLSLAAFAALAALACTFGTSVATAAPVTDDSASSEVVRFKDLNLANPKDAATLYKRISRAARNVCWNSLSVADGSRMTHAARCYDATMDRAISDVNSPALTALHHSNTTRVAAR